MDVLAGAELPSAQHRPSLPPKASLPNNLQPGPTNPPGHAQPGIVNGQDVLPRGDTNAAEFFSSRALANTKQNPLPISSLRTGYCYDIRMRFHQTVDYRDTHPEDPRRIYRIYKELALAGLIEDRETAGVNPDELILRLRARYATEEEILSVHSKAHLEEIQATESRDPVVFSMED
jgi:hypothetical protein